MNQIDETIFDNLSDELYKRGYGVERMGSVNATSEWMMIAVVVLGLYLVWGR